LSKKMTLHLSTHVKANLLLNKDAPGRTARAG
jgi:hypothetical protein